MAFPLSTANIAAKSQEVARLKASTLDELLPKIIAVRLIVENSMHDPAKRSDIAAEAKIHVSESVNPVILDIIFSDDAMYWHEAPPPKNWQFAITRTVEMEQCLRKLIIAAYGDDVDKDILRKKIVGCINAILIIVDNAKFYNAMRNSTSGNYIRSVKVRKNYTTSRYGF